MADQGDDVIELRPGRAGLEARATSDSPPRWAEYALRLVLHPRDRDPISGDLLEEYREIALPALGPARASVWYLKQVGSIMTSSQSSIPVALFVGAGVVLLGALSFVMVRSDFGPPSHEIISFGGVAAIAVALLIAGASVLRQVSDLQPVWRVSRLWGLVLGATLLIGNIIAKVAPSGLLDDDLPHPGHIPGVSPIFVRLFVVAVAGLFLTAGFRGAWKTSRVRQGILAAIATAAIGGAIAFAGSIVSVIFLEHPGPGIPWSGGGIPLAALIVAPMLSTFPGTVGAMFGRGFSGARK